MATRSHANIREEKGPSLVKDKSDPPAEMRGDWRRVSFSSKRNKKLRFFSPSEVQCLPAPSEIKPKKREFVVESGAINAHAEQKGSEISRN